MGRLMHAILIEGGSGELRTAKAIELLKEHFSDDPLAGEKLDLGVFEDLIEIRSEEGKDITVDRIGELAVLFKQKPFASTGKACIIENAERMNEHAQNKLLKLLEEPAAGDVIMILTSNAQRLLSTIRSRCMRIWLGYATQAPVQFTDDLRMLTDALIFGKGSLAEANAVLARHEGSREDATEFLGAFQVFLRELAVGRYALESAEDGGKGSGRIAESATETEQKYSDRMRIGVMLAEKALREIEHGYRIRYTLRGMALDMRGQ